MTFKIRKDGWKTEEDNLLKEIILKKIEQGQTQMSGFEEASQLLGRSKQACAFRWNKNLRPLLQKTDVPPSHKEVVLIKEFSVQAPIQDHLKLALESFEEMKKSYEEISQEYNLLKRDYEQLVNWVKQGITHIE